MALTQVGYQPPFHMLLIHTTILINKLLIKRIYFSCSVTTPASLYYLLDHPPLHHSIVSNRYHSDRLLAALLNHTNISYQSIPFSVRCIIVSVNKLKSARLSVLSSARHCHSPPSSVVHFRCVCLLVQWWLLIVLPFVWAILPIRVEIVPWLIWSPSTAVLVFARRSGVWRSSWIGYAVG